MIGYVMVGTDNLERATEFYDALLAPLGLVRVELDDRWAIYSPADRKDAMEFFVTRPYDGKPATAGNGTMIALEAPNMEELHRFHSIGIESGGTDEGAPGPREEGSDTCYAYIRDPDGNKICAYADPD